MRGAGDRQERVRERRRLQRDKPPGTQRADDHQLLSEMFASTDGVVESKPKKFAALDAFQSVLLEQDGRPKQPASPLPPEPPAPRDWAEAAAASLGSGAEVNPPRQMPCQRFEQQKVKEEHGVRDYRVSRLVGLDQPQSVM